MLVVNGRRSTRLTPRPALGLLYLTVAVLSGALLIGTLVDQRRDLPLLIGAVLLVATGYLGLHQGIYVAGDQLVLQHPLQRTTISLAKVASFTIRPYGDQPLRKALWIELTDGTQIRTNVGVGTGLVNPPIRVSFEKMVSLIDVLESHRLRATP